MKLHTHIKDISHDIFHFSYIQQFVLQFKFLLYQKNQFPFFLFFVLQILQMQYKSDVRNPRTATLLDALLRTQDGSVVRLIEFGHILQFSFVFFIEEV